MAQGRERATETKAQDKPALMRDFRAYLEQGDLGYWTTDNYFYDAQAYVCHCNGRPRLKLDNPGLLARFLGQFASKPHQKARKSTSLRAFFDFLRERGVIESDPLPRLPRGRFAVGPHGKPTMKPLLKLPTEWEQGKALEPILRPEPEGANRSYTRRVVPLRDETGDGIPSERDFEVMKLERELNFYRIQFARLKEAVRQKDLTLKEQQDLWRLGLDFNKWPSIGGALDNLSKIKSALNYEVPAVITEKEPGQGQRKSARVPDVNEIE